MENQASYKAQNPLLYLWKKMWQYSGSNRPKVVLYTALFFVANTVDSLEPLLIGTVLNIVQVQGIHDANLVYILGLFSLFLLKEVVFWSFHGPARVIESENAFVVKANYKKYLLAGTMAMPIEWHTDHHSGDTIDKIEKGTTALFSFSESAFQVIQGIIGLVMSFGILLYYDVFAGILVAILSIPIFYVIFLFDKKLVPGYIRVNAIENSTSAKVFDVLSNVTTVIILRVESLVLNVVKTFIQKPYAQYNRNVKINELKWFTAALLGRISTVMVIGAYILLHVADGGILVGTIFILYSYADKIRDAFFRFAYLYNDIVRQRSSVANAELLSVDFLPDGATREQRLPKKWSEIEVRNLSFSYHAAEGADLHLDDVAMKIPHGARIAFIGESGGGKSTLLKIMRDLYHPKTCTFLLDGKEIPNGFRAISDSISLVPQDPEIFATTIRENITLGVEYPEMHIGVYTDMASFTDVVKRLPKGLESSIVEKGVNLSGGEKQRLALARGLLASTDKDIVLLDEPTSSVDFNNELEIYKRIFEAFPAKAIISSIHRLHLLTLFDSVYFFKGGKIIASGSFEELKKNSTDFQALWKKYIKTRDSVGVTK